MLLFQLEQKWDEFSLAARIRMLVVGDEGGFNADFKPYIAPGSISWTLDMGNNWWLTIENDNPDFTIAQLRHRYTIDDFERWKAMAIVIRWLLPVSKVDIR